MRLTLFRYFLFLRINFLWPWECSCSQSEISRFASLGSFKYGPLPKIWMDPWYVECHMWIMSRSHFFTSRSKIYKCRYILNALLIGPIMDFFLQSNILPNASDYLWINLLILFAGIAITGIGEGCTLRLGLVLDLAMDSCLLFPTKQVYLLAVLESL